MILMGFAPIRCKHSSQSESKSSEEFLMGFASIKYKHSSQSESLSEGNF